MPDRRRGRDRRRATAGPGARRRTRWLDEDEREAWLSLLRVVAKLPPVLDARLERDAGLNLFEYTILAMLSEQPDGALRMSGLASVTNASPSRLSHAARHLEERGYLVREPDPDDGRCIRAVLTPAGRERVVAAAPGHVDAVRELVLDPLTRPQLHALRELNDAILRRVDPEGVDLPEPPPDRRGLPMTIDVHDEPGRHRYEITEDGAVVGFVTYRISDGVIDLIHAEVDPAHGGRGLAARLVAATLDDARRRGLGVLPHCPYVRRYIDAHAEEYLDLVPAHRRTDFGWDD